jgi:hypothetical protein
VERKWQLEGYDYSNGVILLKCLMASDKFESSDPDYFSQIVIKVKSGANNILIGYDPKGEIVKDLDSSTWGVDSNKSNAFSGFKSMTASSTLNFSGINSTLYLVCYEDAISILMPGANYIAFGAHVGKIYLPDNRSDLKIDIDGSGIIIGVPSVSIVARTAPTTITTGFGWLETVNQVASQPFCSSIRIGSESWSTLKTVLDATSSAFTKDVAGKTRLVPYSFAGNVSVAGEVGRSKYLRGYKTALPNLTLLESAANDSKQAWIGWSVSANGTQKLLMLWCKKQNLVNLSFNDLPTP